MKIKQNAYLAFIALLLCVVGCGEPCPPHDCQDEFMIGYRQGIENGIKLGADSVIIIYNHHKVRRYNKTL